jgi:hypothetical protein
VTRYKGEARGRRGRVANESAPADVFSCRGLLFHDFGVPVLRSVILPRIVIFEG